ncbi:pantoate--beta-alanine ligase [Thiohalophilus sp.]|uniref:pantoate--beta-alanine ligase n=1 Tax=Thiohalophilus sp. TaxID=3028392 RepID=UPI002ACDE831|nr:pantoate--beta-alanine ligase [Thiohalophilus sp.]MDZ7663410.1 pantoate--beta-alanine ligase [Thiohalophilus sp.]
MRIFDAVRDMQLQSLSWRAAGWRIAFVPTMGNLHEGHLSLVREAARRGDRVVVSIFVNPLQFNDATDYRHYPRTFDQDRQQLAALGVAAVFAPDETAMYPQGREAVTRVEVPQLTSELEGAHRPGHFTGVATVVTKLFQAVLPDIALFGEKDYQQLLVVRKLGADLNMPVEVAGLPTCREADGLAMSSRNGGLKPAERRQAPELYATLQWVGQQWRAGETDLSALEAAAMARLADAGFAPEYVSVRDATTLRPPRAGAPAVVLGAARLGEVRLIDNLRIGASQPQGAGAVK